MKKTKKTCERDGKRGGRNIGENQREITERGRKRSKVREESKGDREGNEMCKRELRMGRIRGVSRRVRDRTQENEPNI